MFYVLLAYVEKKGNSGNRGCKITWVRKKKGWSGDGSFADESDKEYKDVRENVRSVGFGKNPKGDRSFFMFYSALDILTIVLKLHCQIVKTGYRI